jgi:four helix bundle protein
MPNSYRELIAWQLAMDLVEACYLVTRTLPDSERFGLVSQINRAAVSVPANIAEGFGRRSHAEFRNFLGYANGSLKEIETHLAICVRLKLLTPAAALPVQSIADRTGAVMRKLIASLT